MEGSMGTATWVGGALTGPGQAPALQGAFSGQTIDGAWFFPLDMHAITLATLPDLLSGIARLATSNLPAVVGPRFADGQRFAFQAPPVLSSSLAGNLSAFLAEQHSASAVDSLIDVGLLAAGVILLLICAGLAADAYRPELSLLRVRGGSARQVGLRVLGRACLVAAPGAAAGGLAGLLAVPAADTALPWLPAAAVAVTAIGATTAVAAWQHRRVRPPADTERDEVSVPRRSPRRAVAEVTVIVLAAGALATLHLAGAQSGTYTSGSPVLAALAASLLAARLYPLPVRSLLRVAAARPGPVGFLGLAGAARARRGAVLPALALVLSLTLAAFAAMVAGSVGAGQNTASWQRIGADAALQAAGNNAISMQAQRALAGVPGVTSVTAVFTSPDGGPFAGQLSSGTGTSRTVGLAVVDPGPYAALAGHTPWPDFPAGLLARRTQGRRVPVLVSRSLAAKLADPGQTGHAGDAGILELGGIRLPVAFEAVIGSTPAMPSGGSFVVLPQWAAGALPSIAGPDLLLATGESAGSQRFRRTAAVTVPGGHLTVRQQVISDLRNAPAQAAAERVNVLGIWAAGALAVVAILLGLAASARSRARLASRMSALGMATRQARALVLTETIPLLLVGILGMAAAATGLALLIGQALNLAVFTAGSGVLPVRPDPMALLLPAAGSIAVALAVAGTQGAVPRRRDTAAALRQEEAG
jgi:putative ABC transport system permease protein